MFDRNTWNHLPVCKQRSPGLFKNGLSKIRVYKSYIYIFFFLVKTYFLVGFYLLSWSKPGSVRVSVLLQDIE